MAISAFIYAIAYKGLKQPEVIVVNKLTGESDNIKPISYQKSGLNNSTAEDLVKKLLKLMDEEKPFKNEKLSLSDLSKKLGASTHNLSEIINTKIEQNFYDFVNSYRVEET